jgi:hypothetical protein
MRDDRFALIAAAAFVVMVITGAAIAQTTGAPFSGDVSLQSNSDMNIILQDDRLVVDGQLPQAPFVDNNTIAADGYEFSGRDSSALVDLLVDQVVTLKAVDVSNGPITVDTPETSQTVRVDGTVNTISVNDRFDFTQGGKPELTVSATGNWDLRVNNTGLADGRGVVVSEEQTGEVLAGGVVDADGNVSISGLPSVTSETLDIELGPSEMEVFRESQPNELVSNVSLQLRVFGQGTDQVFQRPVTNGTVSLLGVPPAEQLTATINNESGADIVYRRTIIESVTEQQQLFLLNRSVADTAQVIFDLEDRTGDFPARTTQLIVEKPISKDFNGDGTNTTRYVDVAGDVFGGTAELQTVLEKDERYRLRVRSGQNERVLGAYVTQIDDRSTIRIGQVNFDIPETSGFAVDLVGINQSGNQFVRVKFSDPGNRTEKLEYDVINERTGTVISKVTALGPLGQHVNTISLTDSLTETSVRLEYNVTRTQDDGTDRIRTGEAYAGQLDKFATGIPIDGFWGGIIGLIGIVAVSGLGTLFAPAVGAAAAVASASLFSFIGLVSIPGAALGLASAVTVLGLIGRTR